MQAWRNPAPDLRVTQGMMQQIDKTRNRLLSRARQAEERALAQKDPQRQEDLLDESVWLRLLASLPAFNPGLRRN